LGEVPLHGGHRVELLGPAALLVAELLEAGSQGPVDVGEGALVAVAEARDVDPEHDPGGRAGLDGGGRGGPTAGEAAAGGPAGLPVAAGGGDGLGLAGGLAALALAAVAVLGGVGGLAGLSGGLVALAAVVVVLGLVVGGLAAQAGDRGLALGFLGGGGFLAGLHLGLHRHDRVGGLAEQGGGGLLVVREGGEAGDDG